MSVTLPADLAAGPLTVVVDRDGERVALRMLSTAAGVWMCGGTWYGRPGADVVTETRRHPGPLDTPARFPVIDWWPADGDALSDRVERPLMPDQGTWCAAARDAALDKGREGDR